MPLKGCEKDLTIWKEMSKRICLFGNKEMWKGLDYLERNVKRIWFFGNKEMWKGVDYLEKQALDLERVVVYVYLEVDKKEGRCSKIWRRSYAIVLENKEEGRCWKIRNMQDRKKLCDCVSTIYKETFT